MKRIFFIICVSLTLLNAGVKAQGTAINITGASPDSCAILDVSSSSKGLLIPRMSQSQRLAIANPVDGLTVFQTDDGCFYYFRAGIWWRVCGVPDCTGFNFTATAGMGGSNPVSLGGTIYLTTNVTGGLSPVSYNWTGPSGFSSTAQNPVISGALPSMSGNYSVTVTEGHGCTSSSQVSINVCGTTVIATSNSPVVAGNTMNLSATPSNGTAPYSFVWSGPNGFSGTQQNPVVINAQTSHTGSYIVTVTDAATCTARDTVTVTVSTCLLNDSVVFSYTGGPQTWTVPSGMCTVTFKVWGAQGSSSGGNGGYAVAQKTVTPGQVYNIFVGGQAGYNGGGNGASNRNGGGASDIRFGGTTLGDRIIVAGGGGADGGAGEGGAGGGGTACSNGAGGEGGYYPGGVPHAGPGGPGTCTSGGAAGSSYGGWTGGGGGGGLTSGGGGSPSGGYGAAGTAGTLGTGGDRGFNSGYPTCNSGAGGGGGYYGGGGSADGQCAALGGGGGSSWASSSLTGMQFTGGVRTGDGLIIIRW